ncbi:MAG TPA: alpha-mannosidase [Levilinea sp.]|nr:alpha-mannosidase [Levilinea sp.]
MQKHFQLTRERLRKFLSKDQLAGTIYTERKPVRISVYAAPDRISYAEAMQGDYRPASAGEWFGPDWSTHWFKLEIDIPLAWIDREVHFLWDLAAEGCIWQDGQPVQGLTGSSNGFSMDVLRGEYCLTKKAAGGEHIDLFIEAAINGLFGLSENDPRLAQLGLLKQAEIAIFDRDAWNLLWDFRIVADMAHHLPLNSPRGGQALAAANAMVNTIHLDDPATWPAARAIAARFFADRNGGGQHNLSAIGHAHIDTAWLWPLAETRRKCVRTFTSALLYMDEYPHYKFACSQAQQYQWMKESYPGLFARMRQKIQQGQFIPAGGTWVEPDCNIPSGESLVRQFLFGQRFFRQEFGITCREFWEPDVFGYSAALPQIIRQAGMDRFLTIKLSWSQFNKLSSHTFWWEGLDGSRVLTHFPPLDNYNATATVEEALLNVSNYKDHERSKESYLLFGYGDGGGGPSLAMLEQIQRMQDVDGLPRVAMRSPQDFFTRLEQDAQDLTVWVGELYLELHRGTYTTQARIKNYNRRSEFALHDVEFLAAVASVRCGHPYPTLDLNRIWKLVLTNQFHDIIPGSSIHEVYQDSTTHYQDVLFTAGRLRAEAIAALFPQQPAPNLCAINTTGEARTEIVELPQSVSAAQLSAAGKPLGILTVPSYGYTVFSDVASSNAEVSISETPTSISLENDQVRAVFNREGRLISFWDKRTGRESIVTGDFANAFVLYDDNPINYDAWDVDIFHLEKFELASGAVSARVLETGPLRAALEFEYQIGKASSMRQVVSLSAISPRMDFACEVEWFERHKFLKVEFPINVRAANATYEIQFGHIQRPTHFNTSWDMARFEVPAQRWADLSEPGFGVSLINDNKYGYGTQGSRMRLSLLRSPTSPDAHADMGHHAFRFALLPHAGSFLQAGVVTEAYHFNNPMQVFTTSAAPGQESFFSVDHPSVVIDTVKKAEDSDEIIVRLYESYGAQQIVHLRSSLPVQSAVRCNLLEDDGEPVNWSGGKVELKLRPFELVTLKLFWRARTSLSS